MGRRIGQIPPSLRLTSTTLLSTRQVDLMHCSFAPLAGAAVHPNPVARFDPEEPDGDYDLNLTVPAQRQVGGVHS